MSFIVKNDCTLIEKKQITESIFFLKYEFVKNFDWIAGQYVGITISSTYRRSYSILDYDGKNLCFLIDTKPGGIASQFFKDVKVGYKNQILGPYGRFTLKDNTLDKVFISTGTGIVPFIPMFRNLQNSISENRNIKVFFGARYAKDQIGIEYLKNYIGNNFEYYPCITRETNDVDSKLGDNTLLYSSKHIHHGRVTQIVPAFVTNWQDTEFYICGNPEMVNDMEQVLKKHGSEKIFLERYG